MKKLALFFSFLTTAMLPVVTFGAATGVPTISGKVNNLDDVVTRVLKAFDIAIYILIALAVVYLVWTIVKYFIMEDGDEKHKHLGKIGYALLGLFIILSIWGLVNILVKTFGTDNNRLPDRLPLINN